jgi:ribosomal-protein-serine acetyltransferase
MKFASGTLQTSDDLALVPRHPGDAAEMFEIVDRHRADLREWLTWIDATHTVSDVRRYAQFAQAQFIAGASFDYAVVRDGAIVGAVGLHGFDWASRRAEMGYWLSPDARGRGTMTRAAATLAVHAFEELLVHRLEIHCVVENTRSRAVAERLGCKLEGIMREAYALHGAFRDLALYALLAGERRF